ncbi:caspase family protein [Nocardia niigatensis]
MSIGIGVCDRAVHNTDAMATVAQGYRRAAVCIGVDRVSTLPALQAAAAGASAVAEWARSQGCDVEEHTDRAGGVVTRRAIFESIRRLLERQCYDQLLIYFAGHGVVLTAGTETWLLSDASSDAAEAVNMLLTAEHARSSGIAHVVLISDACRTRAAAPFNGLTGVSVFPLHEDRDDDGELDVYFATAPGKQAYEVRATPARQGYGIFTRCLLDIVTSPPRDIIEYIDATQHPVFSDPCSTENVPVVTSRGLKTPLIETVVDHAASINIVLDQKPQIRVETVLPRFFATVGDVDGEAGGPPSNSRLSRVRGTGPWRDLLASIRNRIAGPTAPPTWQARCAELSEDFLASKNPHQPFGMDEYPLGSAHAAVRGTGIDTITAIGWELADRSDRARTSRMELVPAGDWGEPASAVVQFTDGTGTVLALTPNSEITVVVRDGRVEALDYAAPRSWIPSELDQAGLVEATVAAQDGDLERALSLPTSGSRFARSLGLSSTDFVVRDLLVGYALAERGQLRRSPYLFDRRSDLVSFDVALVTSHRGASGLVPPMFRIREEIVQPFAPMMTRGWLLLADGAPPARGFHKALVRHLVPALYTTLDAAGVEKALEILFEGKTL